MPKLEAARGKAEKLAIESHILEWCGWTKGDYVHITPTEEPDPHSETMKRFLILEKL